ncbi:hypothetical protein ACFL4G_06760 [Thermodesulfobacteriota bacterium]
MGDNNKNLKCQIIIAVIGLIGILGGALFANWEKIFKSHKLSPPASSNSSVEPQVQQKTQPKYIIWEEVEFSNAGVYHGTWRWNNNTKEGKAQWDNGATADLKLERDDDIQVIITRTDNIGISKGLTARYIGKRTGNMIEGTFTFYYSGNIGEGNWRATME